MLYRLSIRHFILIESLDLDFSKGLNVMTGETGAGKSMLLDVLGLLAGQKADSHMLPKSHMTQMVAEFANTKLASQWLFANNFEHTDEHETIIIRRTLDTQGKSRAFINGQAATLSQLKQLSQFLMEMHGQHAQQYLLQSQKQRELLDKFALLEEEVEGLTVQHQIWQQAKQDYLQALQTNQLQQEKNDWLQWQFELLNELQPEQEEWSKLNQQHKTVYHTKDLLELSDRAQQIIDQEHGLLDSVHALENLAKQIDKIDLSFKLKNFQQLTEQTLHQAEELKDYLKTYQQQLHLADDEEIQRIEQRLSNWHQVSRKLKLPAQDLYNVYCETQVKMQGIGLQNTELLFEKAQKAYEAYWQSALNISQKRQQASHKLTQSVNLAFKPLAMSSTFLIAITSQNQLDLTIETIETMQLASHGIDAIEYQLQNRGSAQILAKVASGGELSRILLALSTCIHAVNPNPHTMVFDEIDSGMSGVTAEAVGKVLAQLGLGHQVLTVTHLAQVAACAHQHLCVLKQNHVVSIEHLNMDQRIHEIARLIGGTIITQETKEHAKNLILAHHKTQPI